MLFNGANGGINRIAIYGYAYCGCTGYIYLGDYRAANGYCFIFRIEKYFIQVSFAINGGQI